MTGRPTLRRTTWWVLVACVLAAAAAPTANVLGAQSASRAPRCAWTPVRVAKWALLGVTVGLGYYALQQSTRADRAYSDLRHVCRTTPAACTLESTRYTDAGAEALYATSLRHDRRAQAGILGGQATLLASAALFVYDLRNGRGPENIPFPGIPAGAAVRAPDANEPARRRGVLANEGTREPRGSRAIGGRR